MKILDLAVLIGPNVHAPFPVMAIELELGALEDFPKSLHQRSALRAGLIQALPELDEGEPAARQGASFLAPLFERSVLAVQRLAGSRASFGKTIPLPERPGIYQVLAGFDAEAVGRAAAQLALALLESLLPAERRERQEPFDWREARAAFLAFAQGPMPSPATRALLAAAARRQVPVLELPGGILQFGHGRHGRRLTLAGGGGDDPATTRLLLAEIGLPVAGADAGSPQRALRLLVVGWSFAAAVEIFAPRVVGDGRHSIAELVDEANCDPERGVGHEAPLARLTLDGETDAFLASRGLTRDTLPAAGRPIELWASGDWRRGGHSTPLQVHPDLRWLAERAARMVGQPLAAVDLTVADPLRPLREADAAIAQVDARPDLHPFLGGPDDQAAAALADRLLAHLLPADAALPVVAIAGSLGKTTTARMVAHVLKLAGVKVGLACSDGLEIDGRRTQDGDRTGPRAAQRILADPDVEVAVVEVGRGGLARHGLGFAEARVGAVLDVHGGTFGHHGVAHPAIETHEALTRLYRTVIEAASGLAILNADDPFTLAMAAPGPADRFRRPVWYVSTNPKNLLLHDHVRSGGSAVAVEDGLSGSRLVWWQGERAWPILDVAEIPGTWGGQAAFNVRNAAAAAAIALGLGLSLDAVRAGLGTFFASFRQAPGCCNVYDALPFRVVVDRARTPAALDALLQTLAQWPVQGRRLCVLGAPGDLRDDDVRAMARLAAGRFDLYICRRDADPRGRRPDEVPRLLQGELLLAGMVREQVEVIPEEMSAVQQALAWARKGDLLLLLADAVAPVWELVVRHRPVPDADPGASTLAMPLPSSFIPAPATATRPGAAADSRADRDFGE